MARKEKMITRTTIKFEVAVLGINSSNEMEKRNFTIPEMDTAKVLTYINAKAEDFIGAKVVGFYKVEELREMPESVWLKYSTVVPGGRGGKKSEAEG